MNIKEYVEVFELENTNIVYDGIKRLWEQLLSGKERRGEELATKILRIFEESCKGNEYLSQNLMSEFFRFLGYSPRGGLRQEEAEAFEGMVFLYDKVLEMEYNHDQMGLNKTYSEDYNEICEYLSRIALKMDSYLVHVRDSGNIILASNVSDYDEETEDFIYKIGKEHKDSMSLYADTVEIVPHTDGEEKQKILIKLLLSRRKDVKHKQTVYIVLTGKNQKDFSLCMQISRNVLFLRRQLQLLLERDLYALRHFKISYEDVKPICNQEEYNILHISDLHVDVNNFEIIKQLIQSTDFGEKQGVNDEPKKIDLLVITGDVAQGQSTAMDMETNYRKAEEVIRCLARKIWIDPENPQKIRFDWKKRIIIIPGNHDYASMNELLVVHKNRATYNGEPAREEGSPMIKYTYYIDFLRRLLDLDISDIVKQNLNENRVYPNYKLQFLCFNTVAEVNMLRNNKVQIAEEFYNSLPKKNSEELFRIYLMHHTPLYVDQEMDYNRDKYASEEVDESLFSILKYIDSIYWEEALSKNQFVNFDKALNNISNNGKKTGIFRDVRYLVDHLNELTNERCNQIIEEYRRNVKMRDKDREIYKRRIDDCMNLIKPDIILGGHTHKKKEGEYENKYSKVKCYEAEKFYNDNTAKYLSYGILNIKNATGNYKSYTSKFTL